MSNVAQTLDSILESVLKEHPGVFLVESRHRQQSHEFILDADQAIGIATISGISRSLNHFAEEQLPAEEMYDIDVCSPGADSPLKMLRQFPKHVGREFEVVQADDSVIKGKLISIEGENLVFEYFKSSKPKKNELKETISIPYNQIKKATIILSFK
jgi:ribosome maturation factor RimP